jgi:hypothetical protein
MHATASKSNASLAPQEAENLLANDVSDWGKAVQYLRLCGKKTE